MFKADMYVEKCRETISGARSIDCRIRSAENGAVRMLILISILALLVIAVLIIAVPPFMNATYYETEPYVITEDYLRTETYTEEVLIEYEVSDPVVGNLWWRTASDCSLTIKNTGVDGGYFRIKFNLITQEGDLITKVVWQYLGMGEQKKVTVRHLDDYVRPFEAPGLASTYSITEPVQVIEISQQVPDTREITKYRQVEKTKKVTVLEYLREWL
ncbi:MAG: hypothetical protein MUP21_10660 [Dehalococcoidia bacterium]|nr:hypothetical protein [Dehalococcoidia bacterium]